MAPIKSTSSSIKTQIKVLKAYHGDCILIKTFDSEGNPYNVLVDGGPSNTFKYFLKKELIDIAIIHLLILTHIDSDHIGGLIRFLKNSLFDKIKVEKYWINGANLLRISTGEKISYNQGITLEELLLKKNVPMERWKDQVYSGAVLELNEGINFKVLSPTKEILDSLYKKWPEVSKEIEKEYKKVDISSGDPPSQLSKGELSKLADVPFKASKSIKGDLANSSSIALLLELTDCSILLLGDSRAEVIEQALRDLEYDEDNPLQVDYVKVSHHGSKNNTSCELMNLIDSQNFIISTNGGSSHHRLPDREVIARIIFHSKRDQDKKRTIFFNYPLDDIQVKSGELIEDADTSKGNWGYEDSVTSFPYVKAKTNEY